MSSQLEILEQRLFTAFASADWRDPETREKVYGAIERAIQRLADRPEAESSYQGYVDAFAELRWRVERSAEDAADLEDLAARVAAFGAPEAEEPPPPEPEPPPPPVVPPTVAPPFRPAPPLVADAPSLRDEPPAPDPEPVPPAPDMPEPPPFAAVPPDMRPMDPASTYFGERETASPRQTLVQRFALPALAAVAGLALLLGLFGLMRTGGGGGPDYDSGWVQATNATSEVLPFRHRFGTVPRTVTIWFSADRGTTASLVAWKWPASESGNPISIVANGEAIELHIWNGAPLHGTFDTRQNRWTTHTTGFFRVIASR